jgi:hypothetical protein
LRSAAKGDRSCHCWRGSLLEASRCRIWWREARGCGSGGGRANVLMRESPNQETLGHRIYTRYL